MEKWFSEGVSTIQIGIENMKDKEFSSNKEAFEHVELGCPLCGGNDIKLEWVDYTFNYGSGDDVTEINAIVPVMSCEACDIEFLDNEGERIKHEAICRHHGVLTPNEIKEIRKKYNYTQEGFAKVTKFGIASLNRWERGASIQSPSTDNLLRLLTIPSNMKILKERYSKSTKNNEFSLTEKFPSIMGSDQEYHQIIIRSEEFNIDPQIH
ncbi:MAG: type II toxin-antitoxin system MqsA family antitoxin [Rhodobacteraceae bacterium]|nr:type II toxin-antitoxin system MqsA family antitoxin [Paracoccaceae bacterium]